MTGVPNLLACYWTLGGGYVFGEHDESPWDFRDRAEAAARAGYRGIGIKEADLRLTLARHGYDGMRAILADNGLRHLEIEVLMDWYAEGPARAASDRVRAELLEAAEQLGAQRLKVAGGISGAIVPIEKLAAEFQIVARQARDVGTVAVLEPIAFTNVPDLATALAILGDSAGQGGALMLDAWHVTRAGMSFAEIAGLPKGWIGGVELDDGTLTPVGTPLEDTLDRRRLCGEGEFDLAGLIAAVRASGYDGAWGVEIISDEQRARGLDEAAQRSFDTTARQFHGADGPG
jgi:sugar phosphate isomerase/epimerase